MTLSSQQREAAQNKLRHFLSSVEDLRELRGALPLGHYDASAPTEVEERWKTVLHAMLLRKYYSPKDKLRLTSVAGAVIQLAEGLTDAQRQLLRDLQERVGTEEDLIEFVVEGGDPVGEGRIHEDALYGRYLHGDFGKWDSAVRNSSFEVLAVRFVLADRSTAVERLALVVEGLRKEGHLQF